MRDAVYHDIPLPSRQRLHLRAAQALQERGLSRGNDLAAAAIHLRQAGSAADPLRTAELSMQAAEEARRVYAWDEAIVHAAVRTAMLRLKSSIGYPKADLAVHLVDLYDALGENADFSTPVLRVGFAMFRAWLCARIADRGLPSLRLSDGENQWVLGRGEPGATLTAERGELFRTVSGRSGARSQSWTGDPAPYLPIIALPLCSPQPEPTVPAATRSS